VKTLILVKHVALRERQLEIPEGSAKRVLLAHLCPSLKGSNRNRTGHLKFCSNGRFVRIAADLPRQSECLLRVTEHAFSTEPANARAPTLFRHRISRVVNFHLNFDYLLYSNT
jgi:hypothetical protein